jgi:hypothetical protein
MKRIVCLIGLVACGGQEADVTPEEAPAQVEEAPAEAAPAPEADEPKGSVSFVEPADGATVTSPVHVKFQVKGKEVRKAGEVVKGTGHHHVIVDGSFVEKGKPVPADATHIHYGGGQLEADIPLEPGTHTLTMQFADGAHLSYGEAFSTTISVTVE